MVEEVRAQWEVSGSNRVGRVAMKFTRKMSEMGGRWPVGASIDKKNFIFFLGKNPIFSGFFGFNFAECRALGKGFAECPIKDTRQSWLCRRCLWRVLFAVGEPFAECFMSFAECFGHSANSRSPVVYDHICFHL